MDRAVCKFAWQGIEISVPATWELSAHHGAFDAGYAALDDGLQVRLRVRWSRKPRLGAVDVDGVVRQYQRSLAKASKRQVAFERLSAEHLPKRFRDTRNAVAFSWVGDQTAVGALWCCRGCPRIVILEILFAPGEADRKLARDILGSATDHRDDDRRLWRVYGFAFLTPAAYNLERPALAPGRLQFLFRESRRSWLRVERWALGAQWTGAVPIEQWPDELLKLSRVHRPGSVDVSRIEVNGHPACRFHARAARSGLIRKERIHGCVWFCPADDKVYAVTAGGGNESVAAEVAATIPCA